jgi:hypothetical protein
MLPAAGAACSLVNAYDPLFAESAPDASEAASAPVNDAPAPQVDAGPSGAIVVAGQAEGDGDAAYVLSVLDPATGHELSREPLTVTGLVHDGLSDLWYVFVTDGPSPFARPTDGVRVEVRSLDARHGTWQTLGAVAVPANVTLQAAALHDRLTYVGYILVDGGAPEGGTDAASDHDGSAETDGGAPPDASGPTTRTAIVAVDVSDPSHPSLYGTLKLSKDPLGIIGTPSSTGAGGVANLLERGACDGSACVEILRVLFPPGASPVLNSPIDLAPVPLVGSPAFGSFRGGGPVDLIATRPGTTQATLHSYLPLNNQATGSPVSFDMAGINLKPLVVAECLKTALVVETNADLLVHAVPLGGGAPATIGTGHSGQGVYFEPFTSTVLAPFSQGSGFELTAFKLGGTSDAPTLDRRLADWSPPADLRPILVATRQPAAFVCP